MGLGQVRLFLLSHCQSLWSKLKNTLLCSEMKKEDKEMGISKDRCPSRKRHRGHRSQLKTPPWTDYKGKFGLIFAHHFSFFSHWFSWILGWFYQERDLWRWAGIYQSSPTLQMDGFSQAAFCCMVTGRMCEWGKLHFTSSTTALKLLLNPPITIKMIHHQ